MKTKINIFHIFAIISFGHFFYRNDSLSLYLACFSIAVLFLRELELKKMFIKTEIPNVEKRLSDLELALKMREY